MRFGLIALAAVMASMLLLSAPGHARDKEAIPAPAAVMAAQTAEPTRAAEASRQVPIQDTPRAAGRKPCRKPSGERVEDRSGDMDEFSNFDKR